MVRVGALIQARVGSSRLPGKVLLPLPLGAGVSIFERVVERAQRATTVAAVVAALPDISADDPLADLATGAGIGVWRGSENDVLARFHDAAMGFDHIVRLTADNPALDPHFVDEAVRHHLAAAADYTITEGLPLGMNVEVVRTAALAEAYREATDPAEREHVTPFIRRRPARYRLQTLPVAAAAHLRMTVDYPTDYALQQLLFTTLGPDFGLDAVLALCGQHPWLPEINAANQQIRV